MSMVRLKSGRYVAIIYICGEAGGAHTMVEINADTIDEATDKLLEFYDDRIISYDIVRIPEIIGVIE